MKIDHKAFDNVVDYQVGDVIVPRESRIHQQLCLVKDITEKGAVVVFLDSPAVEFIIPNHELHLMKKDSTGSILYGKNG